MPKKKFPPPALLPAIGKRSLTGVNVAILVADGVEQSEVIEPRSAIEEAGGRGVIIAEAGRRVSCNNHGVKGAQLVVDRNVSQVSPNDFAAVVIPGRTAEADAEVRDGERTKEFVRLFLTSGKPVAALLHDHHPLAALPELSGYRVSSSPDLEQELNRSGAQCLAEDVVVDKSLVTSRSSENLDMFITKLLEQFGNRGADKLTSQTESGNAARHPAA